MGFSHIKPNCTVSLAEEERGWFTLDRSRWMTLNPCVHIAEAVQLHRYVLMCHLALILLNVVVAVQFLC